MSRICHWPRLLIGTQSFCLPNFSHHITFDHHKFSGHTFRHIGDNIMKPRRTTLSVPGHIEKMHVKASQGDVDVIMLDLEDSVPLEAKESARARVVLRHLEKQPDRHAFQASVIHPGKTDWTPLMLEEQSDVVAIEVPLQRGCAMVKIR